jgi:uncharacterized protein (DUF58 family)
LKHPAERRDGARFSVTRFGIAALALGMALFAEGFLHGELAALLSGAGLLSYAAYSLCLAALASFAWRDACVTAEWSDVEHVILRAIPAVDASALEPWLYFCAIRFEAVYRLDEDAPVSTNFILSVHLSRAETKTRINPPKRGRYVGSVPRLVISDFTGIFRFARELSGEIRAGNLIIPARPESCEIPALPAGRSSFFAGKSTFRRSEELYEARRYFSGDDPRRINWNIFAHTGELAIREGELLPPPSAEFLIRVNPAMPVGFRGDSRREAERRFERLVSRAAFVALWLSRRGRIVTLETGSRKGTIERLRIAPESVLAEREILEAFARCSLFRKGTPDNPSSDPAIYPDNAAILVFTMPDQPIPPLRAGANVALMLGPAPEKAKPWSPRDELLKYVFLGASEASPLSAQAYRIRFMTALSSLRKERDNVQTV